MKAIWILSAALAAVGGCTGPTVDGREKCTVEAIGRQTGADSLDATLHIPADFLTGVETSDGGITVWHDDCDFPLGAFLSDETAHFIIENAPKATLIDKRHFFRLVDASLSIWKFSDGSGETRFFVTAVHEMRPIAKARSPQEAEYYSEPTDVR